jgi:ATP-dependent RNA helicase DeaD
VHRIGRTGRAGREGTAITLAEPREHRFLGSIERLTRQKIKVATLPTVADLHARRLELTRAAVHERLIAGDLDDVRVVVESLAQEFDVVDVAAAAVKLLHVAAAGDGDDQEVPEAAAGRAERTRDRSPRSERAPVTRLFIGAGRRAGVRPGDLVGAITNEAGLSSRELGAIEITDTFSLVEVPEASADHVVHAMRRATLRGQKVSVRRDRDSR